MNPETSRNGVLQVAIDEDTDRPGVTSQEAKRIMELEREVRELRRADEILKTTSAVCRSSEARPPTDVIVSYIDEHRERFGIGRSARVLTQAGTKIARAPTTRPRSAAVSAAPKRRCDQCPHCQSIRAVCGSLSAP